MNSLFLLAVLGGVGGLAVAGLVVVLVNIFCSFHENNDE